MAVLRFKIQKRLALAIGYDVCRKIKPRYISSEEFYIV
jgi:hypothetical protein